MKILYIMMILAITGCATPYTKERIELSKQLFSVDHNFDTELSKGTEKKCTGDNCFELSSEIE